MTIRYLLIIIFCMIGIVVSSCEFKRVDTSKMSEEIRSRQIKHITPSQVIALSNDFGQKIKTSLNQDLAKSLLDTNFVNSLKKSFKVKIDLLKPSDLTNPKIEPKVRALLDAYLYNDEKQLPQNDNLQPIANGMQIVFTTPVLYNKSLDSQAKSIGRIINQNLNTKPEGSLLGIWAVTFERKNLVNQIDVKAFGRMKVRKL